MENTDSMENLRLIKEYSKGEIMVTVLFSREWDEYQVQVRKHGKLMQDATYYTDDRADAIGTARLMFNSILATTDNDTN